jgi:hypothetical protein
MGSALTTQNTRNATAAISKVAQPSGDDLGSGLGSSTSFNTMRKVEMNTIHHQLSTSKRTPAGNQRDGHSAQGKKKVTAKKKASPFKINDFVTS